VYLVVSNRPTFYLVCFTDVYKNFKPRPKRDPRRMSLRLRRDINTSLETETIFQVFSSSWSFVVSVGIFHWWPLLSVAVDCRMISGATPCSSRRRIRSASNSRKRLISIYLFQTTRIHSKQRRDDRKVTEYTNETDRNTVTGV